ncbi:MAG: hypothetical protein NUW37_20165 [Planctomycetes bacterium]|nr:hypothetical protein [Planctomycetota bacterium]
MKLFQIGKAAILFLFGVAIAGSGYILATGGAGFFDAPEEPGFTEPEFDSDKAETLSRPEDLEWAEHSLEPFEGIRARISIPDGYSVLVDKIVPENDLAMYLIARDDTVVSEGNFSTQMQIFVTKQPAKIEPGIAITSVWVNRRRGFYFKSPLPLPPQGTGLDANSKLDTFDLLVKDFPDGWYVHLYACCLAEDYDQLLRIASTLR